MDAMWRKWIEKIKNILPAGRGMEKQTGEKRPDQDIHRRPTDASHPEIHTKMTYQYPQKPAFRFPLIPDDNGSEEDNDRQPVARGKNDELPAYMRRNEKTTVFPDKKNNKQDMDIPAYQRRQQHERTEVEMNTEHGWYGDPTTGNEISERMKKPFQPTEVPSPIYGYHKRQSDKNIDDVPAYMRKEEAEGEKREREYENEISASSLERQPPAQPTAIVQKEITEKEEQHEPDKTKTEASAPDIARIPETPPSSSPSGIESVTRSEGYTENAASNRLYDGTEDIFRNKTEKRRDTHKKKKKETWTQKRKAGRKGTGQNKDNKSIPFNVMMSSNDKRHITERTEHKRSSHRQESSAAPRKAGMPFHLLDDPEKQDQADTMWVQEQEELLEKTLTHFNVNAKVVHSTQGPSVTRFEVQPELGVKVSKVKNLSDDLKLNLSAKDIRIEAPIPGKNTIGIEVPNPNPQMVGLQEIFASSAFQQETSPLSAGLGLTIEGEPTVTNIQEMPHGLIAGATGSGKSVCINTILISLLYKAHHEDVKFLLIDPKMVELAPYNAIPHLLSPVITDVKAATMALKWSVREMEDRYDRFVREGVRDIERYNKKMAKEQRDSEKMPFIVIVIDELSDLMMAAPQDVEDAICRIAQKARACGIHLLLATQRPSVDVITGLIKANIPTRIAFSVSSQVDSRTIIDTGGAERLLGKGDMLFVENGAGKSVRLQGAFVSDDEIMRVTDHARSIAEPVYEFEQEQLLEQIDTDSNEDELMEETIHFVVEQNSASTSMLQRHFKIGYNRAARLMDSLVQRGVVSEQNGSKPREVLISDEQL